MLVTERGDQRPRRDDGDVPAVTEPSDRCNGVITSGAQEYVSSFIVIHLNCSYWTVSLRTVGIGNIDDNSMSWQYSSFDHFLSGVLDGR